MMFWFGVVLLIALPLVLLRRWGSRDTAHPVDDPAELAEAERDVRDLDAFTTPEDAADRPDWGPGVPR